MAPSVAGPASVELFYSYAHLDEPLCKELQKHLTALKRSGLIRDWYDRKIEPGSEWAIEIQEAMERAGIILLLISADFLASQYIFDIELPFALKQHDSGRAMVIPVLLRPVEWRDLPFAKLQVLPSDARPVTSWPDHDAAFSDVAGRLRECLYRERLAGLKVASPPEPRLPVTQERVIDAAIASSVVVDEPTDLVTMVRTTASGGLKAILQVDRTYSPTSDDVESKVFELDFPLDESGRVLSATLGLALESPGFDPPKQLKKIRVPTAGDSDVSVFMLTPKRAGPLRLNLQMLLGEVEIGSRVLTTTSVPAAAAQPTLSYGVISLPLSASTSPITTQRAFTGLSSAPSEMPQMPQPPASQASAFPKRQTTFSPAPQECRVEMGSVPARSLIRKIVGVLITYGWRTEGQLFPLFEGRNMIGRDADCAVSVPEDKAMSRKNSSITFRQTFELRDLDSMNGTALNNVALENEFETLSNYASIRAGSTEFIFIMIEPPEPPVNEEQA